MKNNNRRIDGRFWFTNNGEYFAGRGRIELLKHIKETGSIAQAAKVMGMSYKAAWDSVDTMNKMTGQALVLRTSGGRHGGGSKITEAGLEFIERYDKYTETFEKVLSIIDTNPDIESIINSFDIKSSADNSYHGKVSNIAEGAIYSMVEVDCDIFKIYASISKSSIERMGLTTGDTVSALINSNQLILSLDDTIQLSCRNKFKGTVNSVKKGAVNSEVFIGLDNGGKLCVVVTNDSIDIMNISYGNKVSAFCKASSVLLVKRVSL